MLRCALMLAVAASVAGCRDSSGSGTDRPDVLLVTLDTTRADHLGCYGYPQPTSPNLDRIFASGLRFDRAWTPVPLTLPAHASLLTALLPPEHGIHDNGGAGLGSGVPVLHSIGERERRMLRGVELELYDPRTDLEERKDLAAALPEEAAALAAGLDSWLATFVPHEVGFAPGDPRLAERMNALGYSSSSPKAPSDGAPRVDPKTRIGTVNAYTSALVLTQAGRGAEAVPLLEQVIRAEPGAAAFHFQLGLAQQSAGRPAEAESAFRAAIALDPGFGLAHHHLGALLERAGRLDDALAAFRAAVAAEPRAWSHRERVARVLVRGDRRDEALQEMRELIRFAPDRSAYRIDAYRLLRETGRSAEGAQLVLDGLAANPTDHDLALLAAWILATDRDARVRSGTRAVELAERVVAARGRGDTDRLDTLAAAYAEAGRFDDALRTIDEALKSAPADLTPEFRTRRALDAANRAFHEP